MQPSVLFFISVLAFGIAACGDRTVSDNVSTDGPVGQALDELEAPRSRSDASGVAQFAAEPQGRAGQIMARGGPRALGDTASLPTMLIRTGQVSVQVDSLEPAIAALEALASQAGGYVGNTSFTGGQERHRQATLQLRVPSSRFSELQGGITALGKVLSFNVNVQDVGEEYTDATARLKSKREIEERLLDLLRTRTGKLSDVIELEGALQEVREEIEATEGRLRYLRNQVGLSTMIVTLSEPGLTIAEPGYHPIRDAFKMAWRNFIGLIAGLVAATGWALPLSAILFGLFSLGKRAWMRRLE